MEEGNKHSVSDDHNPHDVESKLPDTEELGCGCSIPNNDTRTLSVPHG